MVLSYWAPPPRPAPAPAPGGELHLPACRAGRPGSGGRWCGWWWRWCRCCLARESRARAAVPRTGRGERGAPAQTGPAARRSGRAGRRRCRRRPAARPSPSCAGGGGAQAAPSSVSRGGSGSMSGGGGGRSATTRARLAARLLAVLGCVLTAEAQVGAGGWRDGAAGWERGRAGMPAGCGLEPSRRDSRQRRELRSPRGEGSPGPCHVQLPAEKSRNLVLASVAHVLPFPQPVAGACRDPARGRCRRSAGRSWLTWELRVASVSGICWVALGWVMPVASGRKVGALMKPVRRHMFQW